MDELRQRVTRGDYAVDPQRIADSLVLKMRLIQMGRRQLGTQRARPRQGA